MVGSIKTLIKFYKTVNFVNGGTLKVAIEK